MLLLGMIFIWYSLVMGSYSFTRGGYSFIYTVNFSFLLLFFYISYSIIVIIMDATEGEGDLEDMIKLELIKVNFVH